MRHLQGLHLLKTYKIPDIIYSVMKAQNTTNGKALVLAALFVTLLFAFLGYTVYQNPETPTPTSLKLNPIIPLVFFQFDVYCPIDSDSRLAKINELLGLTDQTLYINFKKNKNVYVVIAKTQPTNASDPQSPSGLFYCGLARKWWENNCNSAKIVCSIPGPLFKFEVKEEATIIYVNDIQPETVNWVQDACYDPENSLDATCTVTQKETSDKCTYYQPTDYVLQNTLRHRINQSSVPISPHIHGLQIRPTFDGNPLSWFNTNGDKGPGYNSLSNQQYYSLFNNRTTLEGKVSLPPEVERRAKIIKVTNDQLPGMLFYHDHAMKSTLYNVQNGFSGLYLINDKSVEARLPSGANEKLVMFAKNGDARVFVSQSGLADSGRSLSPGNYRIRMLNAHYDNTFYNISYSAYYETITQPDGTTTYIEYDPTSPDFPLTEHQHKVPFTIIGADTTMFRDPITGLDQVDLGAAERVDILLNFEEAIPDSIQFVYIVCYDFNGLAYVLKYRFSLPWAYDSEKAPTLEQTQAMASLNTQTTQQPTTQAIAQTTPQAASVLNPQTQPDPKVADPSYIKNIKFNLPFTDLSTIPESRIAVKRHRPLFSLPRDTNFMIGAHYMFEMGASQNSQIGTVEDFYVVNNLWEAHPIHIHLINFQTLYAYSLKQLPSNDSCTLYALDFLRLSGLPQFQLSNSDLCDYIWAMDPDEVAATFEQLGDYMHEDIIGAGKNSGLDSLALYDGNTDYLVDGCEFNTVYKYICGNTTQNIAAYRRRWKDTTLVPPYTVYVVRVRWASTSYDPTVREYPYFSVPEDQLVEFPGFLYHCHILPHEDNEMMRPIMLKHSKRYLEEYEKGKSCARTSWEKALECINQRMGCPL